MSDVSGIPNLGIPAMGGFNQGGFFADPSSGYQAAQAQYGRNNAYFGNQAATLAAAHMPQSQLYGGGSFGAQPAAYAGLGAAYGRATGGFKPPAPASVFQTGAAPFQSYGLPGGGGMGAFSPSPNYPGGRDAIARAMQPQYSPDFNSTFAQFGYHPQQMQQQSAYDLMRRFNGVGTGVPAYDVPKATPPSPSEMGGASRYDAAPAFNRSSGSFYGSAFNPQNFSSSFGGVPAGVGGYGGRGGVGFGIGGLGLPGAATPQQGAGGFGGIGSLQAGAQYGGTRQPNVLGTMPGFIGSAQDRYGNPFIQGSAPAYALQAGQMGGGYGIGGLGQGTAFRGVLGR